MHDILFWSLLLVRNAALIKDERQLDMLGRREGEPDGPFLATMRGMLAASRSIRRRRRTVISE